jgi:nucleoside-diphosphate-sugar epimerase
MKIALTGHRNGLGKVLNKNLIYHGHIVRGFDIVNDFDINEQHIREKVLSMTQGFDVFINNAYCAPGQFEMLKLVALCERYKHVINVGSYVTKLSDQRMNTDDGWLEFTENERKTYIEQKTLQEDWIREARAETKTKTLISTVNPGYMKTNLINDSSTDQALDLFDISSVVLFQIELAKKNVFIPDIDVLLVNNQITE